MYIMKEVIPNLQKSIRRVADFPKKGIVFWDMTTLLRDKDAFHKTIQVFYEHFKEFRVNYVASIESRGLIIGSVLAYLLGVGFIPIRKKGKLPFPTVEESFEKEYGIDTVEIHKDALKKGDKVIVVDDLLATGSTALSACTLIERRNAEVVSCAFITEFTDFNARKKLSKYKIFSLIQCKESE
jgi:adenine phosphoribosyltransferase